VKNKKAYLLKEIKKFTMYNKMKDYLTQELKSIEENTPMDKIKKFFEDNTGWNDEMIAEAGFTKKELNDYADHELGTQILECLEKHGQCNFWGQL
jgi:hypothetical protein